MNKDLIRIAIIGCGAVTEQGHLPAITKAENVQVTLLVDKNLSRAEDLAQQYNVPHVSDDFTQTFNKADAAIVALPHHLHEPVCVKLLSQGIHVLVEKPMALSRTECDNMIKATDQGKAVLEIGLMRRFLRAAQFTKAVLDADLLGPIRSFDIREGFVYNWPVASGFFFQKKTAGGGVLLDTGAHTLDLLLWWLGNVTSFDYFDDNYGGVEADCVLNLVMENGVTGTIELSRTRILRNTAVIRGEKAILETSLHSNKIKLIPHKAPLEFVGNIFPDIQGEDFRQSLVDLFLAELVDWISAIRNGIPPHISGKDGRRSIELIESCYKKRKPLALPWIFSNSLGVSAKV